MVELIQLLPRTGHLFGLRGNRTTGVSAGVVALAVLATLSRGTASFVTPQPVILVRSSFRHFASGIAVAIVAC
jgi:hypothetical protein